MLAGLDGLEADERDLHGEDGAEAVDGAVGDVDPVGKTPGDHQREHVHRDQVDEEHVATPGRHH